MRQGHKATAGAAIAALALAGVVLPLGGATASPQHEAGAKAKAKTVSVRDDYYSPDDLKVKKGGKVVWKWNNNNSQTHNVTLVKAPKGVKKRRYTSSDAGSHFRFNTTFKKPGTYHFVCTIHATIGMTATVKVKR